MGMLLTVILIVAALAILAAAAIAFSIRGRGPMVARAEIVHPDDSTVIDRSGAVRSVQAADLRLADSALDEIWTPMHLERLARTYWRFLTRCTLGLIRVKYEPDGRFVCLLFRPFAMLSFHKPDYEMDARRGIVRWRIAKGFLVSRAGHDGDGYLQIDIRRNPPDADGRATARVEVEVANFYPAIASRLGKWLYVNTQSRIHVIVTHGFLRSLTRLDLAESRVGRFADLSMPEAEIDAVPDPPPFEEPGAKRLMS